MKFQIVSDLHLEFHDLELPGGEALIVAGDMCEARSFGRNDNGQARRIAKQLTRFVNEEFGKYDKVFYVPGNHEYYGRSIDETHRLLKLQLPSNVHLMQSSAYRPPDHLWWLYGTTLWTDVGKDSPQGHAVLQRCMNDFRAIEDFSTWRMFHLHHEYRKELCGFLNLTHVSGDNHGPVIMVTHHAPSEQSVNEKYKEDMYMNMGYYSEMDYLIAMHPQIKLWVHGHMHDPCDYMIGDTRVVCNPRGYYGYEPRAKDYKPLEI